MLPFRVSLGAEHEHIIPSKPDNNKNLIFVFYILRPFSLSHKTYLWKIHDNYSNAVDVERRLVIKALQNVLTLPIRIHIEMFRNKHVAF